MPLQAPQQDLWPQNPAKAASNPYLREGIVGAAEGDGCPRGVAGWAAAKVSVEGFCMEGQMNASNYHGPQAKSPEAPQQLLTLQLLHTP
jgi:hypothetical protein